MDMSTAINPYHYSRKATDIVAYTYNADIYCPACILQAMGVLQPNGTTEWALDSLALDRGIDRYDERTFDSGDFPKVVFASDLEGELCGMCGEAI